MALASSSPGGDNRSGTVSQEQILIISGSNRPGARTLQMARIVERHYQELGEPAQVLNLADLPLEMYDPRSYAEKPAAFLPFQEAVLSAAGMHVITPEYNGSFPGALKYFIDMLKFPESFERRPVAFVGEATGTSGAMRAVEQLQMVFAYRNAYLYPQRVFIPTLKEKLDSHGRLLDVELDQRLARQAAGFLQFVRALIPLHKG